MPMRIKYDNLFNALLTCYAFARTHESAESSNEYYRKLTERIDEYVEQRVQRELNKRTND